MRNSIRQTMRLCRAGMLTARTVLTVLALKILATVFEGFGVVMLVPIFQFAGKDSGDTPAGADSTVWRLLDDGLAFLGIRPDFGVLLGLAVLALTLRQVVTYAHRVYLVSAQQDMIVRLRKAGILGSLAARLDYQDQTTVGTTVNDLVTAVAQAVAVVFALVSAAGNLLVTIFYIAGIVFVSGWVSLLAFIPVFGLAFLLRRLMRATRANSEILAEANRTLSSQLIERLSSIRLVKLAGTEALEAERLMKVVSASSRAAWVLAALQSRIPLIVEPIGAMLLAALFYVGLRLLVLPFEVIIVLVIVIARLLPVVQELAKAIQVFLSGEASTRHVLERLDRTEAAQEDGGGRIAFPPKLERGIEFRGVCYSYPGAEGRIALRDVSLMIEAGKITALVGPSGAGKSTLVDMIPRLRRQDSGVILVDGIPLDDIARAELRRSIAFVSQSSSILSGTIGQHIRYGNPDVSDADVAWAIDLAGLTEFIRGLPQQEATLLGEDGSGLSGGQRQRLDLARAIVGRKQLIILDEPTSNLDLESEALFRTAVRRICRETGATILLIAHRLESITGSDRIVVLREGRVEQAGTHADLMKAAGWYGMMLGAKNEIEAPGLKATAGMAF